MSHRFHMLNQLVEHGAPALLEAHIRMPLVVALVAVTGHGGVATTGSGGLQQT